MPALDIQTLDAVFQSRPDILEGIQQAADTPARVSLFNNIATYVQQRLSGASSDEPAAKRRRVDISTANGHAASQGNGVAVSADAAAADPVLLEIKEISVSVPQRKKFDLCFTKNYLYARASGSSVPVQGAVYPWREIEHAFYLPVPEKSQAQYNYILFPRNSYLPNRTAGALELEPLVFTVPATAPKPGTVTGTMAAAAAAVSDTYGSLFHWALTTHLRSGGNKSVQIVSSDPKLFHSAARNAYRPNEKAVHVKAFRGSKDGFLFFLPTGILWGFKKPLLFLPLDRIVSVSYTNILQRTFNVVVEVDVGVEDGKTDEIEFAMLDQEDYNGINETYVSRHGLADRSMAEQRKAKRELAENAKKAEAEGAEGQDGAGDDGLTELQRAHIEAEHQLQDDEDEDEEDYDPGSDADSDGSGESSEEGGGDDDDDEDDDDDGEGGEEEDE